MTISPDSIVVVPFFRKVAPRFLRAVVLPVVLLASLGSAPAFTERNADKMLTDFLSAFLIREGNVAYLRNISNSDNKVGFWTYAEMIEMVEDAYDRTGDASTATLVKQLIDGFVATNGSDWSWNEYNDDIMWAVSAFVRAAAITGNAQYKTIAQSNFDMSYARAWNFDGDGGMRWKQSGTSKNSIAQSTAAIAAYRLFLATGDTAYRSKARQIYNWQKANLVLSDGHVKDTLTNSDATTYNQGTFLGVANYLNDVEWATKAMDYLRTMGSTTDASGGQKIILDYPVDNDLAGFNGIAFRWAAKFMIDRSLQSEYLAWLTANANVALSVRNSAGLTWSKFHQQTPDEAMYSWACSNAVVALQVVPADDPTILVKITSPRKSGMETRKARILLKGKADSSVVAVYARNKHASKKKLYKAKGSKKWKVRVPLKAGMNKIDVMIDTGKGKPKRAESIKILRTSR